MLYTFRFSPASVIQLHSRVVYTRNSRCTNSVFSKESHCQLSPPPSPVSAAACRLHYAGVVRSSVSFGLLPSVRCIVCYFAFQKPRKTGREGWSTRILSQNHVSLLDSYSIRSGKWLRKFLAEVLPPSSAWSSHEDAGTNCLRNLSIICDTPWRHSPRVLPQYRPILLTHLPLAQCHTFSIFSIWVSDDTVSTTELHITAIPSSRCTFSTTYQSHPKIYHPPWPSDQTAQAPIRQTAHIHRERPFCGTIWYKI